MYWPNGKMICCSNFIFFKPHLMVILPHDVRRNVAMLGDELELDLEVQFALEVRHPSYFHGLVASVNVRQLEQFLPFNL